MKKAIFAFVVAALIGTLLCGCENPPLEIHTFYPINLKPDMTVTRDGKIPVVTRSGANCDVTVSLVEYKSVFLSSIEIKNKTARDVASSEYSIVLSDGRDRKPITPLSAASLREIRDRVDEGGGGVKLYGPEKALEGAVNALIAPISPSSGKTVKAALDVILERYFAFRPIYAHETRKGLLTNLLDFPLEYPLDLTVTVRGERSDFQFMPTSESYQLRDGTW